MASRWRVSSPATSTMNRAEGASTASSTPERSSPIASSRATTLSTTAGGIFGGTLYDLVLAGNDIAREDGGGASDATLYDCIVRDNFAADEGGGLYNSTAYRCLIEGSAGITPLNAGLGWVVGRDKGDFRGRVALEAARGRCGPGAAWAAHRRPAPATSRSVGLRDGVAVGRVSSGNASPTLGGGIALAFVSPDVVVGDEVVIDARGEQLAARCVELPFVQRP